MKQFYKILISSLLCLAFVPCILEAQTTIKGKVRDAETGENLIGATIVVPGAVIVFIALIVHGEGHAYAAACAVVTAAHANAHGAGRTGSEQGAKKRGPEKFSPHGWLLPQLSCV